MVTILVPFSNNKINHWLHSISGTRNIAKNTLNHIF